MKRRTCSGGDFSIDRQRRRLLLRREFAWRRNKLTARNGGKWPDDWPKFRQGTWNRTSTKWRSATVSAALCSSKTPTFVWWPPPTLSCWFQSACPKCPALFFKMRFFCELQSFKFWNWIWILLDILVRNRPSGRWRAISYDRYECSLRLDDFSYKLLHLEDPYKSVKE